MIDMKLCVKNGHVIESIGDSTNDFSKLIPWHSQRKEKKNNHTYFL